MAAFAATTPMSAALIDANEPPNLPMGVRIAERMYTSSNSHLRNFQSSISEEDAAAQDRRR